MATNSRSLVGVATVLTKGSTSSDNFFPMTAWQAVAGVAGVRAAVDMRGNAGDCKISPAYQTCNDPDSPDTPVGIGTAWQTGDGITYPAEFTTLTGSIEDKQWIRFGVFAKNVATATITGCQARIKVDVQGP